MIIADKIVEITTYKIRDEKSELVAPMIEKFLNKTITLGENQ